MTPKVSIVIPIYNAEKYLERCVTSCLEQSLREIQIILVNDGSQDASLKLCRKFEKMDSRILVIDKQNTGVSSTRNKGLEYAEGTYVLFVDADDHLASDMCEILVNSMQEGVDLSVCGYYRETSTEKTLQSSNKKAIYHENQKLDALRAMKDDNLLFVCWNKLFRRELITEQFLEDMTFGEDCVFNMNYIKGCRGICVLPYAGYYYNVDNEASAMKRYHKNMLNMCYKEYESICSIQTGSLELSRFAADHFMDNIWYFVLPAILNSNAMEEKGKRKEFQEVCVLLNKSGILRQYTPKSKTHKVLCLMFQMRFVSMIYKIYGRLIRG